MNGLDNNMIKEYTHPYNARTLKKVKKPKKGSVCYAIQGRVVNGN